MKIFLASSKTAKALSELLGTTKDVMLYEKLLKMQQKIQVQVLKKYKEINEAIVDRSANFKKVSNEIPTENDKERDPVIAKTWRKNKVASKLLKIWKITVHLPQ